MGSLEEAIELSKDCCEKKKLLVYYIERGSSYYGEPDHTDLICANCRTPYHWSSDEQVARKSEGRKLSNEDLYDLIEGHIWFWEKIKNNSPRYYESFIKNFGLDKGRIEKMIRQSELFSEYGYKIEDEKDLEVEGVTIAFNIYSDEPLTSSLNSIEKVEDAVNKLTQPYKILAEDYRKIEVENKVFWEPFCSGNKVFAANIKGVFAVGMKGPTCEIKRALEYLINSYDLPYAIYKPNSLFKKDTDKGVEIAKDICEKNNGKVKKPTLPFLPRKEKYFIQKIKSEARRS